MSNNNTVGDFGDFYYTDNTANGYYSADEWGNRIELNPENQQIELDSGSITIGPLAMYNDADGELQILHKGEWVKFTDIIDKLERMERFINAFVETFDGYGITIGRINKMKEIWKSEKLNFEEAHKDYHNDYINDGDLKIDI